MKNILPLHGGNLVYKTFGKDDADTIFFCHSLGANQSLWGRQIEQLSDTYRIVSCDLRGHGESDIFSTPYSIEILANDILALLDHLDIPSCHFVGLSLGSMIGLWLGANAPDRVKRMVLAGASAKVMNSGAFGKRISHIKQHGLTSMFTELDTRWYADGFTTTHPLIVDAIRTMVAKTPIEGYVAATMAVRDFDITGQLPEITAPMLLITGVDDKATPLSEAKFISETCPNADLIILENASHLALVEKPKLFDDALVNFITGIG